MNNKIERVKIMHKISSFADRAINCIKAGEYMIGDYNAKGNDYDKRYSYYYYKSYDVKFFIGTLAELKEKLSK